MAGALNVRLILLMGLVSFLADWLYESMRAVAPEYLRHLGATALMVGLALGVGDGLAYALRVATGALADKRGGYWLETLAGYALQVAAVACLVLAGSAWQAVCFILLERFAKALRTPARDVIIASAGGASVRGRAFGIHAALDQLGAVAGVGAAAALLYLGAATRDVLLVALVPGFLSLAALYAAYREFRRGAATTRCTLTRVTLTREAVEWGVALFLLGASLVPVFMFMWKAGAAWLASLLYLAAMVSEAALSPVIGYLYDKRRQVTLLAAPALTVATAACLAGGGAPALFAGAVLYSAVMAYADVAAKAHASRLGAAASLGTAGAMWGLGLAAGGAIYGYLVDSGLEPLALPASATLSAAAAALTWRLLKF
jgi:MFS family permease